MLVKAFGLILIDFHYMNDGESLCLDQTILEALFEEVKTSMNDKDAGRDSALLGRITFDRLTDKDIKYLNHDGADAIRELAEEDRGWRRAMTVVRHPKTSAAFWVLNEYASIYQRIH